MANKSIPRRLDGAIDLPKEKPAPPMPWFSSAVAAMTGGVSGAFGWAALSIELPLPTTLMLRSIADIARHLGEAPKGLPSRLACKVAAGAAPLIGATINVIFMDPFQHVADGHFTVRKLERRFGAGRPQSRYLEAARRLAGPRA